VLKLVFGGRFYIGKRDIIGSIGVETALCEWVASEDAPDSLDGAPPGPEFADRADKIFAAAWIISAMAAEQISQGMLVAVYYGDQQSADEVIAYFAQFANFHRLFQLILLIL